MSIKMKNVNASGNGLGGIHISGYVDIEMDNVTANANGGPGIHLEAPTVAGLLEILHLPPETDLKALAELLYHIHSVPAPMRQSEVAQSTFFQKMSGSLTDARTFVINTAAIASQEVVVAFVKKFLNL